MASLTPAKYIGAISEPRKSEMQTLDALIQKAAPGLQPYMQGSDIIGYGKYSYASNRSRCAGEWFAIGLSSRKQYISLYTMLECDEKGGLEKKYNKKLPNAIFGRGCIRFKKIEDADPKVITALAKEAAAWYKAQMKKGETVMFG